MPWYNGDFPPSYKNQPLKLRNKAVDFANALIIQGASEGIAIATGLKKAREFFTPTAKRKEIPRREKRVVHRKSPKDRKSESRKVGKSERQEINSLRE